MGSDDLFIKPDRFKKEGRFTLLVRNDSTQHCTKNILILIQDVQ